MCRVAVIVGVFLVCARAASLPEGSACEDQGVKGTCRKAQACPSYAILSKYQNKPEVKECSRDGNDIVICCTDCRIEDASNAVVTPDGVLWKTGGSRKIYDKCVEYAATLPYRCQDKKVTPRKVYDEEQRCHRLDVSLAGGSAKKRVDFPSLALLGYSHNATTPPSWSCQAFLISERFLLSPAHCRGSHLVGDLTFVAVGVDKRSPRESPPSNWQIYKVKRFIEHPEASGRSYYNDLALIETETEIKFSEDVLPMCLSEQSAIPDSVTAEILSPRMNENRKVQLDVMSEKECSEYVMPNRRLQQGVNYDQFICYKGFGEAKDTCQGSSGRPIFIPGEVPCVGAAVGMASFGLTCAHDAPTVYTRLHDHLAWIQSIVWP